MGYTIEVDKEKKRIRFKLVGFLVNEETEAMIEKMADHLNSLGEGTTFLGDLTEFRIMKDRDVLVRHMKPVTESKNYKAGAFILPNSAIGKLQLRAARRQNPSSKRKVFINRDEAEQWLDSL
ncbi:MAG: hypothetical protein ACFFCZ_20805 [Promethearchaeota archaeon]